MSRSRESLIILFGQRLRQVRKSRGLTQEQLALRAGCDPSYLGLVERGQKSISLRIIDKLCNALGILPLELFMYSSVREEPKDIRDLRERFLSLVRDSSTHDMLSVAMDNIAQYRTRGKSR